MASYFFLQFMIDFPQIQQEIQAEIDKQVPAERFVCKEDLESMPKLFAALKETIRLRPSLATIPRVTNGTLNWKGYALPPKTMLFATSLTAYQDGQDTFNPQRYAKNPMPDYYAQHEIEDPLFGEWYGEQVSMLGWKGQFLADAEISFVQ